MYIYTEFNYEKKNLMPGGGVHDYKTSTLGVEARLLPVQD